MGRDGRASLNFGGRNFTQAPDVEEALGTKRAGQSQTWVGDSQPPGKVNYHFVIYVVFLAFASMMYGIAWGVSNMNELLLSPIGLFMGVSLAGLVIFAGETYVRHAGKQPHMRFVVEVIIVPWMYSYLSIIFMCIPGAEPRYCLNASISCLISLILCHGAVTWYRTYSPHHDKLMGSGAQGVQYLMFFFPFVWLLVTTSCAFCLTNADFGISTVIGSCASYYFEYKIVFGKVYGQFPIE